MTDLPKKLVSIRDQIIDHIHKNTPLPDDAAKLVSWFETDGWSCQCNTHSLLNAFRLRVILDWNSTNGTRFK
jgi:hypothetical protein